MTNYLFDQGQQRERRTVDFLLSNPVARSNLVDILGLPTLGHWFALRIPTDLIINTAQLNNLPGDIDLMAGPVDPANDWTFELNSAAKRLPLEAHPTQVALLAASAALPVWPPKLDTISAAEFKVRYLSAAGNLGRDIDSAHRKGEKQATGLARMGFDRVLLAWAPSTEPISAGGTNVAEFFAASHRANDAADSLTKRIKIRRCAPYGQAIFAVGSLPGSTEDKMGVLPYPRLLRPAPKLRRLRPSQRTLRTCIETWIRGVFSARPPPKGLGPFIIRVCSAKPCRHAYFSDTSANPCPKCQSPPL